MSRRQARFERKRCIFRDYEELCKLACTIPEGRMWIDHLQLNRRGLLEGLQVGLEMRVLVGARQSFPSLDSNCRLRIDFPRAYPTSPPRILVYHENRIFHPHFGCYKRGFWTFGEWIDYRSHEPEEGLKARLIRVINSLRYDPSHIVAEARTIGNPEALEWYLAKLNTQQDRFPLDRFEHPDLGGARAPGPAGSSKKFEVQGASSNSRILGSGTLLHRTSKRFEVMEATEGYSPEAAEAIPLDGYLELSATPDLPGEDSFECWVERPALKNIREIVRWGERTERNVHEQGGLLLGRVIEREGDATLTVVQDVVPSTLAEGTTSSLHMDQRAWHDMIRETDRLATATDPPMQVVGWYHTHPGDLDVFMSSTDLETQRGLFSRSWHVAIVLNPHREFWRVFHGREGRPCRGVEVEHPRRRTWTSQSSSSPVRAHEDGLPRNERRGSATLSSEVGEETSFLARVLGLFGALVPFSGGTRQSSQEAPED